MYTVNVAVHYIHAGNSLTFSQRRMTNKTRHSLGWLLSLLGASLLFSATLQLAATLSHDLPGLPCLTKVIDAPLEFTSKKAYLTVGNERFFLAYYTRYAIGPLAHLQTFPQGAPIHAEFCRYKAVRILVNDNEIYQWTQRQSDALKASSIKDGFNILASGIALATLGLITIRKRPSANKQLNPEST